MQTLVLRHGDSFAILATMPDNSLGALVSDPPYGLEFMGKSWDKLWETGAGMTQPGIGERAIPWPSFGGLTQFGGANPTCKECGGRLRGEKTCECDEPVWYVNGELVNAPGEYGQSKHADQMQQMQQWHEGWLKEVFRCLKPGGIAKVFAATRTFHRLAAAMESVGFVLVPGESIAAWAYGSGFPKSLNVSKAIDAHLLNGRSDSTVTGTGARDREGLHWSEFPNTKVATEEKPLVSEDAKRFSGFGTAMKPAWEPFIVGTKPLAKSTTSGI